MVNSKKGLAGHKAGPMSPKSEALVLGKRPNPSLTQKDREDESLTEQRKRNEDISGPMLRELTE